MLKELNDRLVEVKIQQRNKEKWESQLAAYKNEAKDKRHESEALKLRLDKEEKDVEKLYNMSLANLFYTIIGKKDSKLDQEKQEVLSARLKYDEADRSLQHINQSIMELQKKLNALPNVDAIYHDILKEKERLIIDEESPLTEDYFSLSHKIAELKAKSVEIDEAIRAGERVHLTLNNAIESLESAENWGTYDLLGGGMISTAIKHNRIDESMEWIHQAQADMRTFQKELADIQLYGNLEVDISSLLSFADYFFDGFISDWMVQGRIKDSLENVENQYEEIEQLLSRLRQDSRSIEMEIEQMTRERTRLIESA